MSTITVAALQLAFGDDTETNIQAVSELVREAAGKGAEKAAVKAASEDTQDVRDQRLG